MPYNNGVLQLIFFFSYILLFFVPFILGLWKTFQKAGKNGWKCIIPIYNNMVAAEIAGKPMWWGLLCFIPIFGFIWSVWLLNLLSKNFGKDTSFTLGLLFLPFIFFPILGFGSAQYLGSNRENALHKEIDQIGINHDH